MAKKDVLVEKNAVTIPPDLLVAAEQLAEVLLDTEPIADYHRATAEFEADAQARQLLDQLGAAQVDLRTRQRDGGVTRADLDHLRDLQRQAASNPTITRFVQTQQMANEYLQGVNLEISEVIGVDFGAWARPSRC
ncbi:MAG: YlbF family regulator [Anaerolineae bacterium]|nr:YlbF family regulator [Anaerolineae bacterium]